MTDRALTCGGCVHFHAVEVSGPTLVGAGREGECRWGPPAVLGVPDRQGLQVLAVYPRLPAQFAACSRYEESP